ncbi:MAG: anthranilate synthase component I [Myxococcales bacterium]|nr:anthranilate synthase component I [Myxococcales bacterium]MCB9531582.1 anthranilate synthase component I [Myxococcales bacterium]MCB9532767.1 anthranilate synthase component I [Myxococcales bacterium]
MTSLRGIQPSLDAVLGHRGPESHVALTLTLRVDLESPISVFRRLWGGREGSFLLESVEGGELMGRYSFMGVGVRDRVSWDAGVAEVWRGGERAESRVDDPLSLLESLLSEYRVWAAADTPRFQGGAVGWIGFDCVAAFERVPLPAAAGLGLPALRVLLPEELVIYDHLQHRLVFLAHAKLSGDREASYRAAAARLGGMVASLSSAASEPEAPWFVEPSSPAALEGSLRLNRTRAEYCAAVAEAKAAVVAGEVFQVVLSQRMTVEAQVDGFTLYRSLRALNPSPYMFFFHFDDCTIVGSSPEVLVRLDGEEIRVRPIAGTRRRGDTPDDDAALEVELLADAKELAEHRMLVDLGRNDVGRVAAVGSVTVHDPLHIERYSHVMHIVSDVHGTLAPGKSAFDVFRACFPAGTVSGAPKVRACEVLARLEPDRRGIYAGAVGYFDFAGNLDTCIAIRTLVVTSDKVHVQTGAGIVFDSDPDAEYEECRSKARAALAAIAMALDRQRAATTEPTT